MKSITRCLPGRACSSCPASDFLLLGWIFFFVLSRLSGVFSPRGVGRGGHRTHAQRQAADREFLAGLGRSWTSAAPGPRPPCHPLSPRSFHGAAPSPVFLPALRTPPVWGTHPSNPSELGVSGEDGYILGHSFFGRCCGGCQAISAAPQNALWGYCATCSHREQCWCRAERREAPATSSPRGLPLPQNAG